MNVSKLQPIIEKILKKYSVKCDEIVFTDDVQKWSANHGIIDNNPFRLGKTVEGNPGNIKILVFQKEINETDIQSAISKILIDFSITEYRNLKDLKIFILHLFLHESAHASGIINEKKADQWAFDHLDENMDFLKEMS